MRYEIANKQVVKMQFPSDLKYMEEYTKHIGYGSSGHYDEKTKTGVIRSFAEQCKKLEKDGYVNLQFCNGGDDDVLVIDHDKKQFGFFEDYAPNEECLKSGESLKQIWLNHD